MPETAARPSGTGNLLVPRARKIVSITYAGEQDTYDIEMSGANHNFVANGIVTHNSQLSQRYVDESHAAFVVPPAILGPPETARGWDLRTWQPTAGTLAALAVATRNAAPVG